MLAPRCLASSTSSETLSSAFWSMSGPTSTPSSVPRPSVCSAILAANFEAKSSATSSWTRKRLAAVQASPMLRILAIMAPSTAASRSASAKTRKGALPPSSMETRSSWSADCLTSCLPIGVEPVKVSLRRRGSPISGSMTSLVRLVGTTLRTPFGTPTSSSRAARASIVSGVWEAGLTTIVQPAAMAGPILRVPMASGKFHGVIISVGPTG